MLLTYTAYRYALEQDKNRDLTPEPFNAEADPNKANSDKANSDQDKDKRPPPPRWMVYTVLGLTFLIELAMLYIAVPMAFRIAQSRAQLFLHLFFAITATPAYLFVATVFQTDAYDTLLVPPSEFWFPSDQD
jgi:hypothetical protein